MSDNLKLRNRYSLPTPWLIWLAAAFVCDLGVAFGTIRTPIWLLGYDKLVLGTSLAQVFVVAMFGSLWGRTWVSGWLLATGLLAVGFCIMICVAWSDAMVPPQLWYILTCVPVLMLSCCLPLLAMRSLFGWTLTREENLERNKGEQRIEDLFLFSMVAAAAFALPKIQSSGMPENGELFINAFGLGMSLIVTLPVAWITFRARSWLQRLTGYALNTALGVVILCTIFWLTDSDVSGSIEWMLQSLPAFVLTMLSGVGVILASGYRMTRYRTAATTVVATDDKLFDQADADVQVREPWRRLVRWQTAGVVGLVILFSLGFAYRDYRRVVYFTQIQDPAKYFQAAVDQVDIDDGVIAGVVMSSSATEADLEKVAHLAGNIEELSLAGMQIGDDALRVLSSFRKLKKLNLSQTLVTDKAFERIHARVEQLSLADTRVSVAAAMRHAATNRLTHLDLSGTGIDRKAIETLDVNFRPTIERLRLARNPIDDAALELMLNRVVDAFYLDLSDTEVDGSALPKSSGVAEVNLDGTKVTDAIVSAMVSSTSSPIRSISLRRTAVTAAVLPALAGCRVSLGHGKITEQDLMNLPTQAFDCLGLNGPEFTGECLGGSNLQVSNVDLSDSSVTDETLKNVNLGGTFWQARFANTPITVAGLRRFNVGQLDLRGTQISGDDVLDLLPEYAEVLMRHEAFKPADLLKAEIRRIYLDQNAESMQIEW